MRKRKWIYIQKPTVYGITCDLCGGSNIEWSEYEHMIWCYDCEKDTPGTGGLFDGPIGIKACALMGISFDRIDLATGKRLYMTQQKNRTIWCKKKPKQKNDPQYLKTT